MNWYGHMRRMNEKSILEKFWNCFRLEERETEDLEIRGCRKRQMESEIERERVELSAWNWSTRKNKEEKQNQNFSRRKIWKD